MKLDELAIKVDIPLEHTQEELQRVASYFLQQSTHILNVEGDRFKIFQSPDNSLGLFTFQDEFVGFIQYSHMSDDVVSLDKIFIGPKFRRKHIAKMFVFWFKNLVKCSVFIGGAVASGGQQLITSIASDSRFDVFSYDVRTKEKTQFDLEKFYDNRAKTGMLIETWEEDSLWNNKGIDMSLPGEPKGTHFVNFNWFVD